MVGAEVIVISERGAVVHDECLLNENLLLRGTPQGAAIGDRLRKAESRRFKPKQSFD